MLPTFAISQIDWLLWVEMLYELLFVDEEDCCVCFEIDSFGFLHDFEATCADVALVGEA